MLLHLLFAACDNKGVTINNVIENVIESCCCCDGGCDSGEVVDDDPDTDEPAGDETSVDTASACECPEGYELTPGGDACVRETTVEATLSATVWSVCEGNEDAVYGKFGARAPGGTSSQSDYWGDDDGVADGRLNDVGVWACDPDDPTVAGTQPTGEWIGFSTCIELDEAGDYLVGIAGDNRVRLVVDGAEVLLLDGSATANFNYWWLQPVALTSGKHLVQLTGYNNEQIAAFGAELSGPFEAGSLATDADVLAADYPSNLVFSTGRLQGEVFDVGEDSGWTCPDGYMLDLCVEDPVCTALEYVPCE